MHGAGTLLLAILAAEKSRVPFYIAGGLLATWAVIVSFVLGMRHAEFPGNLGGQRAVSAITAVLVAGAISMAVVTSSSPAKKAEATASGAPTTAGPTPGAPAPAATGSTQPAAPATPTPGRHKATTGAQAPPSSPARAGGASPLALAADPNGLLSFNTKQLSAKAGTVTITFTNASTLEHNVTLAESSKVLGATPTFTQGARTLTLTLKAGAYTFFCSVPGHRQGGMEGTLSVT